MNLLAFVSASMMSIATLAISQPSIAQSVATHDSKPSRPAQKGCAWETFSDANVGLDAWVQRCTFGKRKIDFIAREQSLDERYSDSSDSPELVIAVFDLLAGETPEHGMQRVFASRTESKLVAQCVLTPYIGEAKGVGGVTPAGVKRYTFLPNAALKKALKAKANSNDVPEAACGAWGDDPDGMQYFEVQPASGVHKIMFVRLGQEEPLFDEATLRLR
jgi:hypothetical protein